MDLVTFKRNQEEHQRHLERLRNIAPVVKYVLPNKFSVLIFIYSLFSTSTPESLGLKHLAYRPKKQQLIDDNRQRIAKENAKMMEMMAKVC
jgi:hypothetical protein